MYSFPAYRTGFGIFSRKSYFYLACMGLTLLVGCQQIGIQSGDQAKPMVVGPSSPQVGTTNIPRSQTLPPVSGPRAPSGPNFPVISQTAPRAREPLPSLAELLNRPVNPNVTPEILTSTVPMASVNSVRVALLIPLTGPAAKLGQAMLNAAQLALFQFS
ncbi:hypothetical protein N8000_12010, partial [Rhodospirillales bacterium]|nr:hypothetical protein [Rhodospirillales bacterium]